MVEYIKTSAELNDMAIMALRYALGRHTYVSFELSNYILNNLDAIIDARTGGVIIRDLTDFLNSDEGKEDNVDNEMWRKLLIGVKDFYADHFYSEYVELF